MKAVMVVLFAVACSHAKPVEPPVAEKTQPPAAAPAPQKPAEPVAPPAAPAPVQKVAVEPVAPAAMIYFAFDKSDLTTESRNVLTAFAAEAQKPGARVRIEGNCDERGTVEYNLALGQRRADAAKKYLVNLGVPHDNIVTISFGEERPKLPGHDEASWRENRRDDLFLQRAAVSAR